MPDDLGAKALSEVRELKVDLYGHYPRKSEDDIGAIGLLQRDVTKIRNRGRLLEGIPGSLVKIAAGILGLKLFWDQLLVPTAKAMLGGN